MNRGEAGQEDDEENLPHACGGEPLFGALPEYIWSVSPDALYLDLFAASEFVWERDGGPVLVRMETGMPYRQEVTLTFDCAPQAFALKIRVPRWTKGAVAVPVNGKTAATGQPGAYLTLERCWQTGDKVFFELPFAWKRTCYVGAEQVDGFVRYAYEAGPLLMAFRGPLDADRHLALPCRPEEIPQLLTPAGQPLHYHLSGCAGVEVVPYLEIEPGEPFTCFPLFRETGTALS